MNAHVVLMGPSTAGKTSLMLGLSHLYGTENFTVDPTCTTQRRRVDEGDEEKVFMTRERFNDNRSKFLFTFSTFPEYEYGILQQTPLLSRELRVRILTPSFALKFRTLVEGPTILCAVAPYHHDPEAILRARQPDIDPSDLEARLVRYEQDQLSAANIADINFQNSYGLDEAVNHLSHLLVTHALGLTTATLPTTE
jgi:ribose 1,5-bisphosphokinase PhnN